MDIVVSIGWWLLMLLGLSLVVFLHEGGHFLAARWAGVEVEAFAIGWGKVLWSWKSGVTEYRVCLLPLGGYCKMKGEQDLIAAMGKPDQEMVPTPGSLFGAPAWKRIVISASGPVVNFLSALLIFGALAFTGTPSAGPASRILLASAVDGRTGTAAEEAGLKSGDLVTAVDNTPVLTFADLQARIGASAGRSMAWAVVTDGTPTTKTVTPRWDAESKRPLVGVYPFNPPVIRAVTPRSPAAIAGFRSGDRIVAVDGVAVNADQVFLARVAKQNSGSFQIDVERGGSTEKLTLINEGPKVPLGIDFVVSLFPARGSALPDAVVSGWTRTTGLLTQMAQGLGRLFTGKEDPVQSLSGPIGIVRQGADALAYAFTLGWDFGIAALAGLLAFLSLALFLMNLLPIPALDGGSIVVSLVEGLRRRRLAIKTLIAYQQVGAVIVLGLLLFTTLNDMGIFGKV